MNIRFRMMAAAAILISLAACSDVICKYPVGAAARPQPDLRLVGRWSFVWVDGMEDSVEERWERRRVSLYIQRSRYHELTATYVGWGNWNQGTDALIRWRLIPGRIGISPIVNLLPIYDSDGGDNSPACNPESEVCYQPLLYRFSDERTLELYKLNPDLVEQAIKAGQISGHRSDGGTSVESNAEIVDAYIAANFLRLYTMHYATLRAEERPPLAKMTDPAPLRPTLGTIAVVSLAAPPGTVLHRPMDHGAANGALTQQAVRRIESRFRQVLRQVPVQSTLRQQVLARARKLAAFKLIDGGTAATPWRPADTQRYARLGVRTVLEVGVQAVDPHCVEGCWSDQPEFSSTSTVVARLISVPDGRIVWECANCGNSTSSLPDLSRDGETSGRAIRELVDDAALDTMAEEIVRRVFIAAD